MDALQELVGMKGLLHEIDRDLSHDTLADRMADQGLGPATRHTGADVLARLKAAQDD